MRSKIKELLMDDNSIFIFDVDGVLAPIEYGEYTHYYADDDMWAQEIENGTNFYKDVRVVKEFKDFIDKRDINKIYVITKVMNEKEFDQKLEFLSNSYGIIKDNCYMVTKDLDKLSKIDEIKKKYPDIEDKYLLMIDDTVDILSYVMQNSNYSTVHVSTFLK